MSALAPRRILYFTLQLLLPLSLLQSQLDQKLHETWRWVHFTTDDGLPSNEVFDVVETSDGLAWAITAKGVAWFDGYVWNAVDSSAIAGLPRVQFGALEACEGGDILLWKAETEGGVAIFRGNRAGFRKIPAISLSQGVIVQGIVPFPDSMYVIWGTETDSLQSVLLLVREGRGAISIPAPAQLFGHSDTPRRLWLSSAKGSFWYNSFNGLWLWDGVKWNARLYTPQTRGASENDASVKIYRLAENGNGDGLFVCKIPRGRHSGLWEWFANGPPTKSATETSARVADLAVASDGTAIATYSSGDIRVRMNRRWKTLNNPPTGLKNSLFVRFRGNNDLWVGTREGLSLVRISSNRWKRRSHGIFVSRNMVNEVLLARDSTIWLATEDGVEHVGPGNASTWIREIDGKRIGSITAVNQDMNGDIWIGSGAGLPGVYRWNGRRWIHFGKEQGFPAVAIHKINADREGNLWFSAIGTDYARLTSPQSGTFRLVDGKLIRWEGGDWLPEARSYGVAMSANRTLWFATRDGLIGEREGARFRSRNLGNMRAYDIESWKDGIVVTTQSTPLVYIDSSNHETIYTTEDGLVDLYVWDVKSDAENTLWVATRLGLSCNRNGEWFTFGTDLGLPLQELYSVHPAGTTVYLGSTGGLITLNLEDLNVPFRLDISPPIVEDDLLHVQWDVHSWWGAVTSERIETRYRLDNGPWSSWSTLRRSTVRDLSWGTHRLDVQYKHFFADSTYTVAGVFVDVRPPFYLRPFYYIPVAGLAVGIVYLLVMNIRRKVAHERALRSSLERIARDLHDEIGSNMGTIALISQRLQRQRGILSHRKHELGEVTSTALHTAEALREIVWYINPQHDSLGTLTLHFREIASRMLNSLKYTFNVSIENKQQVVSLELRRNLHMMFKEILHNIVRHSRANKVTILFRATGREFFLEIEDNGIGFDVRNPRHGSGLRNLRHRCEAIGGTLELESEKEGTTVRLRARFT